MVLVRQYEKDLNFYLGIFVYQSFERITFRKNFKNVWFVNLGVIQTRVSQRFVIMTITCELSTSSL
jgi:hypothetical protein